MTLNVDSCIAFHNRIVSHARPHLPTQHQPKIQRSWFAAHDLNSSSLSLDIDLDDNIKAFLSGIDIVAPEPHQHLAFSPFLVGIARPEDLRLEVWQDFEDYDEFILLYNGTGYDSGGLVYSRTTRQVCYVGEIFDDPREQLWGDLHVVLEFYIRCIDAGKFVVDAEYPDFGDQEELVTQGWRVEGWTNGELTVMLSMWSNLGDAIVAKMHLPPGDTNDGLIPLSVLDLSPAIPPFARAFLSQAKKLPFISIAPHLQVPDAEFIYRVGSQLSKQFPEASLTTLQHEVIDSSHFLLFPWRTPGVQFASQDGSDRWQSKSRSRVLDDRAGLYLA